MLTLWQHERLIEAFSKPWLLNTLQRIPSENREWFGVRQYRICVRLQQLTRIL